MERGINEDKCFHVGRINNNNNNNKIKQSSKTGAFSDLPLPHPSKAPEAKPVSKPLLGNQVTVYFNNQHHYHIIAGTMGTIPSPPGKNTLGKVLPDKISLFA